MAQYWDVVQWHESRNGKKFTRTLGSARQKEDGGFWVELLALPICTADGCKMVIQPQRDRQDSRPAPAQRQSADSFNDSIDDLDAPF